MPRAEPSGLLAGKRAIVTGGASGIGRAACERMAAEGACVTVLDRQPQAIGVAEAIGGLGYQVDVRDPQRMASVIVEAAHRMGGLDLMLNNAGLGLLHPTLEVPREKWQRVIDVNLTGTLTGICQAVPLMSKGGAIVNVASTSAIRPAAGEAAYAATKAALVALTATCALEYAPSIRVNAVSPGMIATPLVAPVLARYPSERSRFEALTPLARMGDPVDVADVIVFLFSDLARFITGQNLVVDGGLTLRGSGVDGMLERMLSDPTAANGFVPLDPTEVEQAAPLEPTQVAQGVSPDPTEVEQGVTNV